MCKKSKSIVENAKSVKKNVKGNENKKGNNGEIGIVLETGTEIAIEVGMVVADHAVETDDDTKTKTDERSTSIN